MQKVRRCAWAEGDTLYEAYHDDEWGRPLFDDQRLFEFLILEGAQAGLSWITILRKRQGYRQALDGFDPVKIARYRKPRIEKLLNNPGIVRNRLKIESTVGNAKAYLDVLDRHGSFSDYIWRFVDGQPIQNRYRRLQQVPATTAISDTMSKALKKDGFRFVGSTICYAYMQACGLVNDHLVHCAQHDICRQMAP